MSTLLETFSFPSKRLEVLDFFELTRRLRFSAATIETPTVILLKRDMR
jgi:hypothetical protein